MSKSEWKLCGGFVEPFQLLEIVASVCERLGIRYVTVGSLATIVYGEARFTNDIDVVIDLELGEVDDFCASFPGPEYYLSRTAAEDAVRNRRQFSIIHTTSGLKVDCILTANEFDRAELDRGIRKEINGGSKPLFAAPEDVILKKMEYFREGGSDKHLRDIAGVLMISGDLVDRSYIRAQAETSGTSEIWNAILARLSKPDSGNEISS
jgi:hypothetical protein